MFQEEKRAKSVDSATTIVDEKKHVSITVTELSSVTELASDEGEDTQKLKVKVSKHFEDFDFVAPGIWHRCPQKAQRNSVDSAFSTDSSSTYEFNSPDVVMLFSWTGALPRHISKYTAAYSKIYPSSPVVLITTSLKDLAIRSSAQKQKRLQPAVDLLTNQYRGANSILVHVFSEGGSNKAVEFAEAYHKRTGEKFPCQAICLDSTPGRPRFLNTAAAFRKSLPLNPLIRLVGCIIGYIIIAFVYFLCHAFIGVENNIITITRKRLDDERYWNLNVPRCYLYSLADDLIYWKDIEDHGVEAARRNMPVVLVRFKNSPHCNHIREDADEYWASVKDTWNMRDIEDMGLAI